MKYIQVFQIKDVKNCAYAFRWWAESTQKEFNITDYKLVYRETTKEDKTDADICEDLYRRFNISGPEYRQSVNYSGTSLSTSDVIRIDDMNKSNPKYYYCNDIGWKDVSQYIKKKYREKLSDKEYNAILKLTHNTKLDSVFDVVEHCTDSKSTDMFFDFEEYRFVSLKSGLTWLLDALAYPLQHDGMTDEEANLLCCLFREFGVANEHQIQKLLRKETKND